ncbi:hypothetical protein C8J57DRAFT_1531081 [Mycena rebaudengoi]|nr:hypothetical protein C8J57DRAFT_1531081 [Mycena rebaudengoi]
MLPAVPSPALLHRLIAHAPLRSLDLTLPATPHITLALAAMVRVLAGGCACDSDCDCECEDLRITHPTLRKPPTAYLSTSAVHALLAAVAQRLRRCVELVPHRNDDLPAPRLARLAAGHHCVLYYTPPAHPAQTYRGCRYPAIHRPPSPNAIPQPPAPAPPPHPADPLTQPDDEPDLLTALAHLAPLRTLRPPLPAVWAPALLHAPQNAGGKSAHPYPSQWTSEHHRRYMYSRALARSLVLFWVLPPHPRPRYRTQRPAPTSPRYTLPAILPLALPKTRLYIRPPMYTTLASPSHAHKINSTSTTCKNLPPSTRKIGYTYAYAL